MIFLEMLLPKWVGDENGIIENLQLLWLIAGFVYCFNARKSQFYKWCNDTKSLWTAGMIYFFLLFMREISCRRTFFTNPDGSIIQYSQMGLFGKLVHPIVALNHSSCFFIVQSTCMAYAAHNKISDKILCYAARLYLRILGWRKSKLHWISWTGC